jgi:hypothetical protein
LVAGLLRVSHRLRVATVVSSGKASAICWLPMHAGTKCEGRDTHVDESGGGLTSY